MTGEWGRACLFFLSYPWFAKLIFFPLSSESRRNIPLLSSPQHASPSQSSTDFLPITASSLYSNTSTAAFSSSTCVLPHLSCSSLRCSPLYTFSILCSSSIIHNNHLSPAHQQISITSRFQKLHWKCNG